MADSQDRTSLAAIPSTFTLLTRTVSPAPVETAPAATADTDALGDTAVSAESPRAPIELRGVSPDLAERYQRLRTLGQGGMGRVEQARDADLLRDIAVKVLQPELQSDAALLSQFLWEARVTAYLDHPNIVPVYDLGMTPDGQLFYTMKLVRGMTLETLVARLRAGETDSVRAFTLQRRLRCFLQLCSAIAFAHARGVLHRDIKPANVMLGKFGETLVTDWGLALPLPGPAGEPLRALLPGGKTTQSAGTPMYMSPEQVRGEEVDARSDIYALGVLLYEVVSLERAFDGASVSDVLAKVSSGHATPLSKRCPHVSSALAAVVHKAMALAPADRYPSVSALADDIETVLDGRTPTADRVSVFRQLARYYLGRDPAMAQLRVMDYDLWALAAGLVGGALGAHYGAGLGSWWWGLLAGAVLASIVPTARWLRLRRRPRPR